jgi:protein-tyrosine phosphatase
MERRIELEGCLNFRDLGGYPTADGRQVRWRQLFRSDALHHLTDRGVARFSDELGIRHVVDLRSTDELESNGRGPLSNTPAIFHHLPLFDGAITEGQRAGADVGLADRYFLMAEFAKAPIARVVDTLAHADGPAVYHCAAGKDRTGVISAILLGLLGVRDEVIVADYAATQQQLDAIIERLLSTEGYQEMLEVLPEDTMTAEPETMISLLDQIQSAYGSMEGYAREIGLDDAVLAALRGRFLED